MLLLYFGRVVAAQCELRIANISISSKGEPPIRRSASRVVTGQSDRSGDSPPHELSDSCAGMDFSGASNLPELNAKLREPVKPQPIAHQSLPSAKRVAENAPQDTSASSRVTQKTYALSDEEHAPNMVDWQVR